MRRCEAEFEFGALIFDIADARDRLMYTPLGMSPAMGVNQSNSKKNWRVTLWEESKTRLDKLTRVSCPNAVAICELIKLGTREISKEFGKLQTNHPRDRNVYATDAEWHPPMFCDGVVRDVIVSGMDFDEKQEDNFMIGIFDCRTFNPSHNPIGIGNLTDINNFFPNCMHALQRKFNLFSTKSIIF